MSTYIVFKSLPLHEDTNVSFSFRTVHETKKTTSMQDHALSAPLTDEGLPADKASAIAVARMYAAITSVRKRMESEYLADYRAAVKAWRERMEAIADGESGLEPYPKPVKPSIDADTASEWAKLDEWMDNARQQWGHCGRWTFKVGQWQGTLSAVLTNRPNMTKIAQG